MAQKVHVVNGKIFLIKTQKLYPLGNKVYPFYEQESDIHRWKYEYCIGLAYWPQLIVKLRMF